MVSPADLITSQYIDHVCKTPCLSLSLFASLCKLSLILRVGRIFKKWAGDICKETLDIEFEQDCSAGLVATDRKLKMIFF